MSGRMYIRLLHRSVFLEKDRRFSLRNRMSRFWPFSDSGVPRWARRRRYLKARRNAGDAARVYRDNLRTEAQISTSADRFSPKRYRYRFDTDLYCKAKGGCGQRSPYTFQEAVKAVKEGRSKSGDMATLISLGLEYFSRTAVSLVEVFDATTKVAMDDIKGSSWLSS